MASPQPVPARPDGQSAEFRQPKDYVNKIIKSNYNLSDTEMRKVRGYDDEPIPFQICDWSSRVIAMGSNKKSIINAKKKCQLALDFSRWGAGEPSIRPDQVPQVSLEKLKIIVPIQI